MHRSTAHRRHRVHKRILNIFEGAEAAEFPAEPLQWAHVCGLRIILNGTRFLGAPARLLILETRVLLIGVRVELGTRSEKWEQ